jgi:hypothetical protein
MPYNNLNRPGERTSTTIDPRIVEEDVDSRIHQLEPNATPLQTLSGLIGRGKSPQTHKVIVRQEFLFDNYDFCSAATIGTGNDVRFARLTLDQPSRPLTSQFMYYEPQDKFYIVNTGQTVEVVMTETDSISINKGVKFSTPNTGLTGGTTSTTLAGTVLVRAINAEPIKNFTNSWVIYLGRTIYESQNIEAMSRIRDLVYDCNFVEHKEAVFIMTEDQKKWVKTKLSVPDWDRQQTATMKEFKVTVDYNALFSERWIDETIPTRPKRHMNGLYHTIKTNIAVYDPYSLTDFENMFSNFLFQQAFRYNPNDRYSKLGICGGRFLFNFNKAFREFRRTDSIGPTKIGKEAGLDLETYVLPGQHKVNLIRSEALRMDTPMEHWCFVIDPALMEWRIVTDYKSKYYQNNDERDHKIMMEWQGTIAWHLEQSHALLKTNQ